MDNRFVRGDRGANNLLDLDSRELDVSGDLESSDVVRVSAVSERGEALSVDVDLEGVLLVGDGQVEADSLFEWDLALALLISPLVGGERVADDVLQRE